MLVRPGLCVPPSSPLVVLFPSGASVGVARTSEGEYTRGVRMKEEECLLSMRLCAYIVGKGI